ncbi:FecCD family ABC transporter permease [Streptococcus sp. 20-1249]|uniref:FecCD family ABC transporter permease n=1 Tax=Streptococcus hepaticus TaxID=3349163 RepID=UPI00374A10B5
MTIHSSQFDTKTKPKSFWLVFCIFLFSLILGLYLSLRFGAVSYSHQEVMAVLKQPFKPSDAQDIIIDLRIPRIIGALLVGAAFAVAGAIMQGVTRNPIADPGLLGINAGAGLALVAGYAIFPHLHYLQILLFCLLGAFLAALIVFSLAYTRRGYHQIRLVLAGAMVATLLQSIGQAITIYFHLSSAVIGWQAGGLIALNWKMLAIIAPFILLGLVLAQLFSHQLTILSLDDTVAKSLGQKTGIISLIFLGIVLLLSSAAVALVGSMAFVGLIIPHMIRSLTKQNYQKLLPLSALAGASFILYVDLICRTINPPYETPLNAIVSFIGLPCFIWLLRKGRHL